MIGRTILIPVICLLSAGSLALKAEVSDWNQISSETIDSTPVYMRFLGEGRSIVSGMSLYQADRYFHGGAGHCEPEHGALAISKREYDHEDHHEVHAVKEPLRWGPLMRLADEVALTEHKHLKGKEVKEIVPWLYYAAEIDPHNITAYTLSAYYLCDRLGKAKDAIVFLREGLANNPDSWELNAEMGRIYFEHVENYEAAVHYLIRARELIGSSPHDKFQERYVLSFLAESYDALGEGERARELKEQIGSLFPEEHEK